MEFSEVVRRRRMVRRYDPDRPVPREVIERCLANAVRAPSAGFSQGWDFLVLRTQAERDLFWVATTEEGGEPDAWLSGIRSAPVLIVCLSHKDAYLDRYAAPDKGWVDRDEARWPVPYWDVDTGMASLLILLTAVDEGLGGLFFGVEPGRHAAVHDAFAIPADRTIVGVVSLGYALPGQKSPSLKRHRRDGREV
ncbi:MAG: nitroreductase family protein, partial [Terracoccus sp.]